MSEELIKRGLDEGGTSYGDFEYLDIGDTHLSALRDAKLIPYRDYTSFEARKPDGLIIDRRSKKARVVAVVEFKKNLAKDDGIGQAADVGAAVGAKFCISSDAKASFWFLPDETKAYNPVHHEDGTPIKDVFLAPGHPKAAVAEASRALVHALDERLDGDRLRPKKSLNPSALARSVWQDIYTAGNTPSPDKSLATFVEIFMFKYLSDLGVLTTDQNGVDISFEAVLSKPAEQCLRYYRFQVRQYLRDMFPEGPRDRTTIMNGFTLNAENADHNYVFKKILTKFKEYEVGEEGGRLVDIDKQFKSRLFEEFLKGSVGQRSLGQFFTPRRLMSGIVDMADVESLPSGSSLCDPACGVGGFVLEAASRRAARLKRPEFQMAFKTAKERKRTLKVPYVKSDLIYRGFDKGSDKIEENLTIILAKANFVIYQSDLLSKHPDATLALAESFNDIFQAYSDTALGSLSDVDEGVYNLILSNPPYVTSGSANLKEAAKRAGLRYDAGGTGVEGLFVEKIVKELAPGGRAFVILPDGVFLRGSDAKLREMIARECFVDGMVSLPNKTFFGVNKKTYVLCLRKKQSPSEVQQHPIFSYIVTAFGETLDTGRHPTSETDMPEMARLFRAYVAVRDRIAEDEEAASHIQSGKLKLVGPELLGKTSWTIDRFWTNEEKAALGLYEEKEVLTEEEYYDAIRTLKDSLDAILKEVGDA
ncbi:HsdM family class I SAM-dependent methyltransferase [Methylobacterium sp. sgz302541]|uniref:HsdM family class I SAM-dependent methyltransferase n=1 Tax=unclassified Methylobacterium TaxID=2615210 RepID=UPI003D346E6D